MAAVVTMHRAAPSFWPEALPAVTVASSSDFPSIGLSFASFSTVDPERMCSSVVMTCSGVFLVAGSVIGTISSANFPSSVAEAARRCDSTA